MAMHDVKVELPTGEVIWARIAEHDGPTVVSAMAALHRLSLAELRSTIQGVSRSMHAALDGLNPDEVTVEFGLELGIKAGKLTSVLAEGSGKASIKVTVGWTCGQPHNPTPVPAHRGAVAPRPPHP